MALFHYVLVLCTVYFYSVCAEIGKESSTQGLEYERFLAVTDDTAACDCGTNSYSCRLENGAKVCQCKYNYRQENGLCEPFCAKDYNCEHGASCVNEKCECKPGTRGVFCDKVDGCEGMDGILRCGDPDQVFCDYDPKTEKPFCHCRTFEYLYYAPERTCIECDCDKRYGSCSLVEGEKKCSCKPGTAVKLDTSFSSWSYGEFKCTPCDCGEHSNGCSYKDLSGNGIYWSRVCDCKEGYSQLDTECNKCSCGSHGKCYYTGYYQKCDCDAGYKPFLTKDRTNLTCEECDCGKNGVCSFEQEEKQCKCNAGYAEKEGKCVACQCYADNKAVNCLFEGKIQHCLCPEGYENGTFFCKDIDECLSPKVCPRGTHCVNTMGSYECPCKDGYRAYNDDPKEYGCDDIDECEDEDMCPRVHTTCTNLPGSYTCECEWGYEPMFPYQTPTIAGCQLKQYNQTSPWKAAVIILGVAFALCIAGLGIAIFIRRRNATIQRSGGTTLRHLGNR